MGKDGDRAVWALNKRMSNYQPKVWSPSNVALVKDLELTDTVITFKVKSTRDTGGHRDCCVFFSGRDPEHFSYVHLRAKPDPANGRVGIGSFDDMNDFSDVKVVGRKHEAGE